MEAWASRRSFQPRPDPPEKGTGAGGRKLLRDTHQSTTDPEARLFKRARADKAVPSYMGHVLIENRNGGPRRTCALGWNGLVVAATATQAGTAAEREAALLLVDRHRPRGSRPTLGADKGYQHEPFVAGLRERGIVPHIAEYEPNPYNPNYLTEAERNDPGMAASQRRRKLVEKVFGWGKSDRPLRQVKVRRLGAVNWVVEIVAAAHNLLRMHTLLGTI